MLMLEGLAPLLGDCPVAKKDPICLPSNRPGLSPETSCNILTPYCWVAHLPLASIFISCWNLPLHGWFWLRWFRMEHMIMNKYGESNTSQILALLCGQERVEMMLSDYGDVCQNLTQRRVQKNLNLDTQSISQKTRLWEVVSGKTWLLPKGRVFAKSAFKMTNAVMLTLIQR